MADITEYLEQIENAVYGKDVRQAIHDGIEQCYEDGKAGAIDLEARTSITELSGELVATSTELNEEIAVERARIDNIASIAEGSTTGDAELMDIRVGADGVTYNSAGAAVRAQIENVENSVEKISNISFQTKYNVENNIEICGIGTSGVNNANTKRCRTDYIKLNGGLHYKAVLNTNSFRIVNAFLYDESKTPITILNKSENYVYIESVTNAVYFRISFSHIDTNEEMSETDLATVDAALSILKVTDETLTKFNIPADANAVGFFTRNLDHVAMSGMTWEVGTIGTTTGNNTASETRIRTVGYYPFENIGLYLQTASGYKYSVRCYDKNYTFISEYNTRFNDETKVISHHERPNAAYIRIIAARIDDSTILDTDITEVVSALNIICSNVDPTLTKPGFAADAATLGGLLKKNTKILGIGNSYTRDILRWVWKLLRECGYINVIVGHGYIGGITLAEQYNSLQDEALYHSSFQYWKYSESQDATKTNDCTLESIIEDEDWDVVIFQQQSDEAGQYTSFVSNDFDINNFVTYIKEKHPEIKIGLALTWSHAAGYTGERFIEYYNGDPSAQLAAIKSTIPQVANHMTECDFVINYGLAIEEGRKNAYLGALGDEMLRSDKNHLYYGIPSYMCGLVLVKTITNASINELTWFPTSTDEGQTCVTNSYLAWLGRQCAKIASDKI